MNNTLSKLFGPKWANVRTANIDGIEMHMAHDICKLLNLSNVTFAIRGVTGTVNVSNDNRTKEYIEEFNAHRKIHLVTLGGVFQIILNNKSEECKRIKNLITSNVLTKVSSIMPYLMGHNEPITTSN